MFGQMWKSCLGDTTLHGVRYLSLEGANVARKLIWFAIIVTSLCFCVYTFVTAIVEYYKYETNVKIDVKPPG